MLLLTTPDYVPKLGGLTTHTLNIEKVLKKLNIPYELFHWRSYQDIVSFPAEKLRKFEWVLNIHSGFHMYMPVNHPQVINFICGAEILFYSPNVLKHLIKLATKRRCIRRVENASYNIFISDFTFRTLKGKGLVPDHTRDLIFHMCVDTQGHRHSPKDWAQGPLKFICVARDVLHKNFAGAIRLCEKIRQLANREVELITVTDRKFQSDIIKISSHTNPNNQIRDELLASAHINLLLSLDHSSRGFFEGFGQIVQEAGCFTTPSLVLGTGGLPESVHHDETGWVLPELTDESISRWWANMSSDSYRRISERCYQHTLESHNLESWERLFKTMLTK